jgi:hypothetical protein
MKRGSYLALRMTVLAICALAAISMFSTGALGAAEHASIPFFVKEIPDSAAGGYEPHIIAGPGIDGKEWIYIDSPTGLVTQHTGTGGNLWISKDGGETWSFTTNGLVAGAGASGDSYTAISSKGIIYYTDLYLAMGEVSTSTDGGQTFIANPAASVYPVVDRQWLVIGPTVNGLPGADDQTIYFAYNQLAAGLFMVKSQLTEQAIVWIPCNGGEPITQNVGSRDYFAVDQKDGTIYCPNAADNSVYVSTDGGETFMPYPLEGMKQNLFVSVDVDSSGNVYAAWSDQSDIYVAVSKDKAQTWKTIQVTDTLGTRVMPWVTAGDAGMIGLTWYETPDEGGSNSLDTSIWNVTAALCTDALSDNPTFYIAPVQKEVHKGTISTGGLDPTGAGADRDLGDLFTCDVDKDGMLIIVYGNDWSDGGASNVKTSAVVFAKQIGGPSLKSTGILPDFTFSPASPTTAGTVKFIDNSSVVNGTIASWLWSFGDGANATEQSPSNKYAAAGTYAVKLTVTSSAGKTSSISKDVAVSAGAEKTQKFIPGFETIVLVAGIGAICIAMRKRR